MALPDNERFAVLTGGPGSGKSTLIDQLGSMGFARSEEAGRGIIRDQAAIGGAALPWHDRQLFAELMLGWELRSYRLAEAATSTVLFDRGIPDVIGYLRVEGLPVPEHVHRAAREFRYRGQVFVAPPWPEIYVRDEERKQSPEVAERTCEAMVDAYTECGYELVELPRASVRERAEFVVDLLS